MNNYQSDLEFCHSLGPKGFRPWQRMKFDGIGEVEFVSYAFPDTNGGIYINARTSPGDATTMQCFQISRGSLVLKKVQNTA